MLFNFGSNFIFKYKLKNPNKYYTNIEKIEKEYIEYKTEQEFLYMKDLDENNEIFMWAHKEIKIDYFDLKTKETLQYIPHFYFCIKKEKEKLEEYLVDIDEVKLIELPELALDEYKKLSKTDKKYLDEAENFKINQDNKYNAAKKYCQLRKIDFLVLTQDGYVKADNLINLTQKKEIWN